MSRWSRLRLGSGRTFAYASARSSHFACSGVKTSSLEATPPPLGSGAVSRPSTSRSASRTDEFATRRAGDERCASREVGCDDVEPVLPEMSSARMSRGETLVLVMQPAQDRPTHDLALAPGR